MNSLDTPILFIIFNRPDVTARVFETIKHARPKSLFIAADGPRSTHPKDSELCEQTRAIVSEIDWPCDVRTKFNAKNLGCKYAVSSAISWFFQHVDSGIILEDDCLPDPSFFSFCENLLKYYQNDARVMHIAGCNFQNGIRRSNADYYFSIYAHVWGWATWKRAWARYDVNMRDFSSETNKGFIRRISKNLHFQRYWNELFLKTSKGQIDTWDYQWQYAIWKSSGLCVIPQVNLIANIGFGAEATHTQHDSWLADLPVSPLKIEKFSQTVAQNAEADKYTGTNVFGLRLSARSYLTWLLKYLAQKSIRTCARLLPHGGK